MPSPPAALNSPRNRWQLVARELVAPWVRDDRAAAARADPRHRVGEARPTAAARNPASRARGSAGTRSPRRAPRRSRRESVRNARGRSASGSRRSRTRPGASPGSPAGRTRRRSAPHAARGSRADGPDARRAPRSQRSIPRPTMWIVISAQVTEISTPGMKRMPSARAASAAWASPASSSWSVSASTVTPFAAARRTTSAGASVPSEIVEWQWRSKLQVSRAPIAPKSSIRVTPDPTQPAATKAKIPRLRTRAAPAGRDGACAPRRGSCVRRGS